MTLTYTVIRFLTFGLFLSAASGLAEDRLYESFRTPPSSARPFVRWWWNGNRVNERELLRELDVMRRAGIGGVEINTIGMPESIPAAGLEAFPALDWLSPEWNRLVKTTAEGARERGMIADLIVGSGWPFGGRFLQPTEQTQRIRLVKKAVIGPGRFDADLDSLTPERRRGRDEVKVVPKVVFLRLAPQGASRMEDVQDLMHAVAGSRIAFDIPAGEFTLLCGLWEQGFTYVKLGAPGADGPVVNHFDSRAVRRYLDNVSTRLAPALGGRLGSVLRAMFVDSLELDHANWTADFEVEFERRRGYRLAPYLPFILDLESGDEETAWADTARRARYDFCKTLVELFHERFLTTYVRWCRENGVQARMQAYGREAHPLGGSMLVDLPEGESWLWSAHDRVVPSPTVANKYVSSAAHLTDKRTISFEAMTNAVPVFRETLEDFKLCFDMSLMSGVIHPIVHGFNYTPPEAGFPGWVRFGSYLNEKNSWWPYFRLWSDYASRLSAVLLQTEAQASVAILGPRADEWSRHFLLYQPFPEVALPWYHYHLWQALNQVGFCSDFVSEEVLQQASMKRGKLRYGKRAYDWLILQDVQSLEVQTAAALEAYAKAGGRILIVGAKPFRCPGLKEAAKRDAEVRSTVERLIDRFPGTVRVAPAPAGTPQKEYVRNGLGREVTLGLLDWAAGVVRQAGIQPPLRLSPSQPYVQHIHHRSVDRDLFLFANTSREEAAEFRAGFPTTNRTAWRWDPETGARSRFDELAGDGYYRISLQPAESLLLVFERDGRPAVHEAATAAPATGAGYELKGDWRAEFRHVAPDQSFSRSQLTLSDISRTEGDPQLATFAGTIVYQIDFDNQTTGLTCIDLGRVFNVSEVVLNGKPLGTRWWGRHVYPTQGALHVGTNRLEIKVTTMLGNYCKSLANTNPVARRWAFWFSPIAAGLVGPVRVCATSDVRTH